MVPPRTCCEGTTVRAPSRALQPSCPPRSTTPHRCWA